MSFLHRHLLLSLWYRQLFLSLKPLKMPLLPLALLPVPLPALQLLLLTLLRTQPLLPLALQPLLLMLLKPLPTMPPRKPLTLLPQPRRSNSSRLQKKPPQGGFFYARRYAVGFESNLDPAAAGFLTGHANVGDSSARCLSNGNTSQVGAVVLAAQVRRDYGTEPGVIQ